MRIISFAYTTAAVIALIKNCTRRDWAAEYAAQFRGGELLKAYDRSPRFRGTHVGDVRLTCRPKYEPMAHMPDEDYVNEGFEFLYSHPEFLPKTIFGHKATRDDFSWEGFDRWRHNGESMWTVRFEIVQILPTASQLLSVRSAPLFQTAGIAI